MEDSLETTNNTSATASTALLLCRSPSSSTSNPSTSLPLNLSRSQATPSHDVLQIQPYSAGTKLSFFQRYFTTPLSSTEEPQDTVNLVDHPLRRRFSILARGSLIALAAMLLIICGLIATTVALTLSKNPIGKPEVHAQLSPVRIAILANFPDPSILYDNSSSAWYAFATNSAAGVLGQGPGVNASANLPDFGMANVQMATSRDFLNWKLASLESSPLPNIGAWAQHPPILKESPLPPSHVWAPAVIRRDDGKFVMYYSAIPDAGSILPNGHPLPHCIGAAVSTDVTGPYTPMDDVLACPVDRGGAIDPEAFRDSDGALYVVYKIDGNNIGYGGECGNTVEPVQPTPIILQKVQPDGVTPNSPPIEILDRTDTDGPLVEAPKLIRSHEGIYFLFFSSGCTRSPSYTLKYATATSIEGPYVRADRTLLETGDWGLQAPGSVGIAEDGDGGWNMAFHARVDDGDVGRVRAMFTTKLVLSQRMAVVMQDT